MTTVDQSENVKIAELIQTSLQQIGVKLNLSIISADDIQRDIIKPREYEILLYG